LQPPLKTAWEGAELRSMDNENDDFMLRIEDVMRDTTLCKSMVYALMAEDKFPKNRKINNISVWSRNDVQTYIRVTLAGGEYRASIYQRNYQVNFFGPHHDEAAAA
jgi:predicted DNA-binding transcriptional regulator AlpA